MELTEGVRLHFIPSEKFKTNSIRVRFSAPLSEETIGGRVLTASMLETSNALYPTSQAFRERLANLYGANYTTSLSKRGLVHYLDVNLSFVRDRFLSRKNVLTDQMLDFLKASLFNPLVSEQSFDAATFEIEKKNVLNDLEAEIENHFYHAHRELNQLFYDAGAMQLPRSATVGLVERETPQTSYLLFQKMLQEDQIDFFFIGDFNEIAVREKLEEFNFSPRRQELQLHYRQDYSNVLREGLEQKDAHQSIIEMAYHFSVQYGDKSHLPLIVLNGLLGGFAHSKLFVNVREQESLAYTVSSNFDIFSGLMRIYAGIDRRSRTKAVALMNRQVTDLKKGKFTEAELEQTKKMLRNSVLLAQDRQSTLMERAYMSSVLGRKFLPLETWLEGLESVSRDDIIHAANDLKLQAIYFMEGN